MKNDYSKKQLADEIFELMINQAARRLIEIKMLDPKAVAQVIEEIFDRFAPPDVTKRVLERVEAIKKLDNS